MNKRTLIKSVLTVLPCFILGYWIGTQVVERALQGRVESVSEELASNEGRISQLERNSQITTDTAQVYGGPVEVIPLNDRLWEPPPMLGYVLFALGCVAFYIIRKYELRRLERDHEKTLNEMVQLTTQELSQNLSEAQVQIHEARAEIARLKSQKPVERAQTKSEPETEVEDHGDRGDPFAQLANNHQQAQDIARRMRERVEQAEVRAKQAETKVQQAEVRAEKAEAKISLLEKFLKS